MRIEIWDGQVKKWVYSVPDVNQRGVDLFFRERELKTIIAATQEKVFNHFGSVLDDMKIYYVLPSKANT